MARLSLATFLAAVASSCAARSATLLYAMPKDLDMSNASIVRVDPSGGSSQVFDHTLIDLWRVGNRRPLLNVTSWDLNVYTHLDLPRSVTRALVPSEAGSTAVQFANATFGCELNLFSTPIVPPGTLGTITIENNWSPGTRVLPWAVSGGELVLSVDYQVPQAEKTGVAIYSSWTFGISHKVTQQFIWYESSLWDLDRPLGRDAIFYDTISGNLIIHSPLSNEVSAFHTMLPNSAFASSSVWEDFNHFHFSVNASQVSGALAQANAKYKLAMDTDAANWALVHMNVELEGTPGARAAHALRGMQIEWVRG